jgi:hypothetical protein
MLPPPTINGLRAIKSSVASHYRLPGAPPHPYKRAPHPRSFLHLLLLLTSKLFALSSTPPSSHYRSSSLTHSLTTAASVPVSAPSASPHHPRPHRPTPVKHHRAQHSRSRSVDRGPSHAWSTASWTQSTGFSIGK